MRFCICLTQGSRKMPSFDVSSEMNWQEMDNAVNQATKELAQRYDFKGVKAEIKLDQKAKTLTLWCSEEGKLDARKRHSPKQAHQTRHLAAFVRVQRHRNGFRRKRPSECLDPSRRLQRKGQRDHRRDQGQQTQSPGSDPRRASPRDRQRTATISKSAIALLREQTGPTQSPDAVRKFQRLIRMSSTRKRIPRLFRQPRLPQEPRRLNPSSRRHRMKRSRSRRNRNSRKVNERPPHARRCVIGDAFTSRSARSRPA